MDASTRPDSTVVAGGHILLEWHKASGRFVSCEVDDSAGVTDALVANGATLIAGPVETLWRSSNSRLDGPGGLQLTLFTELDDESERSANEGFGTTSDRNPPSP